MNEHNTPFFSIKNYLIFITLLLTSNSSFALSPSEINNGDGFYWSDFTNSDSDSDFATSNSTVNFDSDGSPLDSVTTNINEELDQDLLQNFYNLVPEGQKITQDLLENTFNNIKVKDDETGTVTVKVGFLNEGAGYRNALGYFIYDETILAAINADIENFGRETAIKNHIEHVLIFPNSSKVNSGGSLNQGDQVDLGITLSAGQSIGFFINSNGWSGWEGNQKSSFLFGQPFYTLPQLNPTVGLGNKYHVIFNDESSQSSTSGFFAYGFEDIRTDGGDKDYNDLIFNVEVTPIQAIDNLDKAIKIQSVSDVIENQGILAFEDNWPLTGDYDFNDAVVSYNLTKTIIEETDGTTTTSFLKNIEVDYEIKALGATFHNGLAMRFSSLDLNNVESITLEKTGGSDSNRKLVWPLDTSSMNCDTNHPNKVKVIKADNSAACYPYPLVVDTIRNSTMDDNNLSTQTDWIITLSENLFDELNQGYNREASITEQQGCYFNTSSGTRPCPTGTSANTLKLTITLKDNAIGGTTATPFDETAPFDHFLFASQKGDVYTFPRIPGNSENWWYTFWERDICTADCEIGQPGNRLEIHKTGFNGTARFVDFGQNPNNLSNYNIKAQDMTDANSVSPFITKNNNLPWMLDLPLVWQHPKEGVDMNDAYPSFGEWLANPSANAKWYKSPKANKTITP